MCASLVGWVPPLVGFETDASAPPPEAGWFAIEQVEPRSALRELAGVTLDTSCH